MNRCWFSQILRRCTSGIVTVTTFLPLGFAIALVVFVVPIVHEYDPDDADIIYQNLKTGHKGTTNYEEVKKAPEDMKLADVAKENEGVDIDSVVASLVEKGLAFEDRGRAISLVLRERVDDRHYYSTTLHKVDGRVPDDGGFDPRQIRSPELVSS